MALYVEAVSCSTGLRLSGGTLCGLMAKKGSPSSKTEVAREERKVIASNRRARHNYDILETVEAGIVLRGAEVKSLRDAQIQLKDGYARPERGELLLLGVHIAPYSYANGFGSFEPERPRKLLLHRREMDKLADRIAREQLSLVPLSVYFTNGLVKVELGLAKGRKQHDKRANIAEQDAQRDIERAMVSRRKGR